MGNWRRLGFDQHDPWTEPETWVCAVVNNRADRVPRSKVFAQIMVEDIFVDRFFLIGTNLRGLQGFIAEAWLEHAHTQSLRGQTGAWEPAAAREVLRQAAFRFRQPILADQVRERLRIMLQSVLGEDLPSVEASVSDVRFGPEERSIDELSELWDQPKMLRSALEQRSVDPAYTRSVLQHVQNWTTGMKEYQQLDQAIEGSSPEDADSLDIVFRQLLETWFQRKIVVIEDHEATGEEIIATITEETPPGFFARIMGLQNIKGTGLDFVYRFQAWDHCYEAAKAALSSHEPTAEKGVLALASMPELGQLCQEYIAEIIPRCRLNRALQKSDLQTMLDRIESKLSADLQPVAADQKTPRSSPTLADWNEWFVEMAEQFLDVNDSIRRRESADQIYRDLANGRISRQRAVAELRKLNKRQKGGWLKPQIKRWRRSA